MLKTLVLFTIVTLAASEKTKYTDPFADLDKHISHTLTYHYLWPWSQLLKAASFLDEDGLDEPQIISDDTKLEVRMNVKSFKPDELRVRVKNRNIIVEAKRKLDSSNKFMANHFVQRFILPAGSKQEEVTAVLTEDGVLSVAVPRQEVPPPPPEIEVPIEVRIPLKPEQVEQFIQTAQAAQSAETQAEQSEEIPEKKTEKPKKPTEPLKASEAKITEPTTVKAETTQKKVQAPIASTHLEQLDMVESTTHVGKTRKKELKETKTSKDNEVTKGVDNNGLDYALIETE